MMWRTHTVFSISTLWLLVRLPPQTLDFHYRFRLPRTSRVCDERYPRSNHGAGVM